MDGTLVDVKICIKSLFTVARIKQRYRFQIDQANSVGAKTTKRRAHHHRVEGCRVVHLIYAFDARREQALKSDTESQNGNWTNDEKSYGDKLQCTAANRSTTLLKLPRVGSKKNARHSSYTGLKYRCGRREVGQGENARSCTFRQSFLVACTRLYDPLCPSVGTSVTLQSYVLLVI